MLVEWGVDGHLGDWSEGKTEDIHRSKVTAPCGKGGIPELLVLTVPSGLFLPTILYCFVSWEQEPAVSVYLFIYRLVLQREMGIIHILILVLKFMLVTLVMVF